MDFPREIRLLYEAFYNFKSEVTAKLENLEQSVHRQDSLYNLMLNIERKLSVIIPTIDNHSQYDQWQSTNDSSPTKVYRSMSDIANSAPPVIGQSTKSIIKPLQLCGSDTNISYLGQRTRKSPAISNNVVESIDFCEKSNQMNKSSSEEEVYLPVKLKSEILVSEFESKPDSGLDSDGRDQGSGSSFLQAENDPLMSLLDDIERRAIDQRKRGLVEQITEKDRFLGLLHDRTKMVYQKDLVLEKLKTSNLQRDNCQYKIKEMRKTINALESDKEWLVGRLEENIANKKQVMGKIGGMHSQFVKKNREKFPTNMRNKFGENSQTIRLNQKKELSPQEKERLRQEVKLKDIVQETNVTELRRKLIKSVVKNYALQSKIDVIHEKDSSNEVDDDIDCDYDLQNNQLMAKRCRIKNGTFTKSKMSLISPQSTSIINSNSGQKSKIPTIKSRSEVDSSLNVTEQQSSLENSCKSHVKSVKVDVSKHLLNQKFEQIAEIRTKNTPTELSNIC